MREKKKIAILGGGFVGLTAAYFLSKKNYQIILIEKEQQLGGLASGFREKNWDFFLEKTVHHLFVNDKDILNFAKSTGFYDIFFKNPKTASLYKVPDLKIFPLDTPLDLLNFPLIPFFDRIRAGVVLAFLKASPFFSFYENQTAEKFLKKTMGGKAYNALFEELFRKKFGKYAENILASFFWARIKKRTKKLGYIKGGFQNFINHIEKKLIEQKVEILKNYEIKEIKRKGERFSINQKEYDVVVSTLPTPVLTAVEKKVFPEKFTARLKKIKYSHSISMILKTDRPILDKNYWINILAPQIPIMGLFQQTNFVDKKNYGGKDILYCGWYVGEEDKLWSMDKKKIIDYVKLDLDKISNHKVKILNSWLFKARYAQPLFDKEFLKNKPGFVTPIKNFFIANLDMTYPYDRGTNYAVKLGKEVTNLL